MKKILSLSAIAVLAVTAVVSAQTPAEPRVGISSVKYSCPGKDFSEIVVILTDGSEQIFGGRACDDKAVAVAVADRFDLDLRQRALLESRVRREEAFTENPTSWLGANWLTVLVWVVIGALIFGTLFSSAYIVRQQKAYIVERLGRYSRTQLAGFKVKIPFIERVAEEFELRQQQEPVDCDTKTADNVFLKVRMAVQFKVTDPQKAFYELADFASQMKAYVFDEVRAAIPSMKFDEVFQNKEQLAERVRKALAEKMTSFGYQIVDVLVTDITPPEEIQNAMNQVVTQQRLREAANEKGEAEKILVVKAAEAKKAQEKLHGEGIAAFRDAIAEGTRKAMEAIKAGASGLNDEQVSALLITTQYFDTLKEVAKESRSNTLFLPSNAGASSDIMTQILAGLTAARRKTPAVGTTSVNS